MLTTVPVTAEINDVVVAVAGLTFATLLQLMRFGGPTAV
jgi:hypothetical protein